MLSYFSEVVSYLLSSLLYLATCCWNKLSACAFSYMSNMNISFIHIRHMFPFTILSSGFSIFQISYLNHAVSVGVLHSAVGHILFFLQPVSTPPPPLPRTLDSGIFSVVFTKSTRLCMSLHVFLPIWHLVFISFSCVFFQSYVPNSDLKFIAQLSNFLPIFQRVYPAPSA